MARNQYPVDDFLIFSQQIVSKARKYCVKNSVDVLSIVLAR